MPQASTPRRTPPATKWVLNELAAQRGALQRQVERVAQLQGQELRCEKRLRAIQQKLRLAQAGIPPLEASIGALQTSLSLVSPGTSPACIGVVRAHTSSQRNRGTRKHFVLAALREAFPLGLTTSELRLRVAEHFGLALPTDETMKALGNSIRWILVQLEREGLVYRPFGPGNTTEPNTWRWRDSSSLDQLRALAGTQASGHDPPVDAAGGQVDRQ